MSARRYHIAQFNYARVVAPVDDPRMHGFVSRLRDINGLADRTPGFVWRLQTAKGDATEIRAYDDERVLVTLSLWESIEAVFDFTYRNEHAEVMRDRRLWFEHIEETYLVLWWVPAGHIPGVEEGKARLERLRRLGPTSDAFTFRVRFPCPTDGTAGPSIDRHDVRPDETPLGSEAIVGGESHEARGASGEAVTASQPPPVAIAQSLGDIDVEEFRHHAHRAVDWIADYLTHPGRYPVLARTTPGEVQSRLPAQAPESPEGMEGILEDFQRLILPGITHWNHPRFFGYFAISGSGPGIVGELLTAALNVNAMLWRTSPAATELEETVLAWLRQMLGLPDTFRGSIVDTASIGSLLAIAAARERIGLDVRRRGLAGRPEVPRLRLYASVEAHSSIEKAAITLGLGTESVRKIPTDEAFRMDPEAAAGAVREDIAAGWRPFCLVATVGTTSTTSVDPVRALVELCRVHGLWLHVDAAYAGSAAIVPELRHVLDGCEDADSLVVNPHKWLFTPLDCSAFYVRDPATLRHAFSLVPEYLRDGAAPGVTNYMDWGIQLGRRFRALKLWMVLRAFGREGLVARIRQHVGWARTIAARIDAEPDFERLAPTPFSTICFRARPRDVEERMARAGATAEEIDAYLDTLNEALLDALNASGRVFFTHTRLRGRFALRMAIGNIRTTEDDVVAAWDLVREQAVRLQAPPLGQTVGAFTEANVVG